MIYDDDIEDLKRIAHNLNYISKGMKGKDYYTQIELQNMIEANKYKVIKLLERNGVGIRYIGDSDFAFTR